MNMSIISSTDAIASLDKIKPQIGSYGWQMAVLRFRAQFCKGYFPNRAYNALKRSFRPDKPYFLGTTGDHIRFLGDWQDKYSVHHHVSPHIDADFFSFLQAKGARLPGAFLDIGANVGLVSVVIAKDTQRTVIAFEPLPETAKRTACTFALNHLTNVQLVPIAVGNQNGEISFFVPSGQCNMASAYQNQAIAEQKIPMTETRVMSQTLDWLYEQGLFEKVGFIKIDVEGNEYNVIQGAEETLRRNQPDIFFEYNPQIAPDAGWTLEDICAKIKEAGPYTFQVLSGSRLIPLPTNLDGKEYVNIYCTCISPNKE